MSEDTKFENFVLFLNLVHAVYVGSGKLSGIKYNLGNVEKLCEYVTAALIRKKADNAFSSNRINKMKNVIGSTSSMITTGKDLPADQIKQGPWIYYDKDGALCKYASVTMEPIADFSTLQSTKIFKFVSGAKVTYLFLTNADHKEIHETMLRNDMDLNKCIQGAALVALLIEARMLATDSSMTTFKLRDSGEQSGGKRNTDPRIRFSTENVMTAHFTGLSLPGRLQKAVRTHLGAGTSLANAISSAIKLKSIANNDPGFVFTEQALSSSLQALSAKLTKEQMQVANHINNWSKLTKSDLYAIFSQIGASLDTIFPKVDKFALPHPAFLLTEEIVNDSEGKKGKALVLNRFSTNQKSIFDFSNLEFMNQSIEFEDVGGILTQKGVQQSVIMASVLGVYSSLEQLQAIFKFSFESRDKITTVLKNKLKGKLPVTVLQDSAKSGKAIHFLRGTPTASAHQAVPQPILNTKSMSLYIHAPLTDKFVPNKSFSAAFSEFVRLLANSTKLSELRSDYWSNCNGMIVSQLTDKTGYFNEFTTQDDNMKSVIHSIWSSLGAAVLDRASD